MSTTITLKVQARALEQQEQWGSALQLYQRIVAEPAEGEDIEVGLWNRIGDLHMRLGNREAAVEAYDRAVQAYESVGLHNNALALCGKILRITPGRAETHLKLALISASKGFAADARGHLDQFVGRAVRNDHLEKALEALLGEARRHVADAGILEVLVEQLRTHEWGDRLEAELAPECDRLRTEGFDEEADCVRLILDGGSAPKSTRKPSGGSTSGLGADLIAAEAGFAPHADSETAEPTELPVESAGATEVEKAAGEIPAELELLEIDPLDGLETTQLADREEDEADLLSTSKPSLAELDSSLGELASDIDDGDADDSEPLPLMTFEPELDIQQLPDANLDLIEAGRQVQPAELEVPEGWVHPEAELDSAEPEEKDSELPLIGLASFGDGHSAAEPGDDDSAADSGDLPLLDLSKRVDADAAAALPGAELAPDPRPKVDPDTNITASGDADRSSVGNGTGPRIEATRPEDDFIDLSALIFDDEEPATTRFVVDAEEPSGDEDRDFAEMLQRFREQVAKNIDVDDDSSHYDLGVAFKEMGLYDEAISEFQTALRAGANPVATMEMLGECFIEKGQPGMAWRVLDQAARLSGAADAELVGVLYLLGRCEEALGRCDAARDSYERVLTVDIRFRDTGDRLEALRN